jgi:hypothetical protein
MTMSSTSSADQVTDGSSSSLRVAKSNALWDTITPLGRPVVPDV